MKLIGMLQLTLLITLGSCRSTTTYRPTVYGHDYITREIIEPKTYRRINTGDKEFNKFVSFSLDDLAKLRLLLKDAKLSKKVRIIIEKFDKDLVLCVMEMHGDLIYRAKEKETGERWDNIHIEEVVKIVKRECDE